MRIVTSFVVRAIRFCAKYAAPVIVLSVLLAVVSSWYAVTHFAMTTDVNQLISPNLSWRQREAEMEMHVDAMMRGERVVLVDDLLATGGTSAAAAALIAKVGGELLEAQFLIELGFLNGRKQLEPTPVISFLKY